MHGPQWLSDLDGLGALEAAWRGLWAQARFTTPFQHPAWLLAFYREMGITRPRALAVWSGQELIGLAPLYLWGEPGQTRLVLAGNGVSDYLDALVARGAEGVFVTALP